MNSCLPALTAGCGASTQVETSTQKINYEGLPFSSSTDEIAWFGFKLSKSVDVASDIKVRNLTWSHGAAAAFGIAIGLSIISLDDSDSIDGTAMPTDVVLLDTGATTDDIYHSGESAAITPGNTWSAEDQLFLRITRLTGDAGDTLDTDAVLISFDLVVTTNLSTDA